MTYGMLKPRAMHKDEPQKTNFITRYYMQLKLELRTGLDFKGNWGKVNLDTKPH